MEAGVFELMEGKTRVGVAHATHAEIVSECWILGDQLTLQFGKLVKAEAELRKMGITTTVDMPFPLNEAWAEYRVKNMKPA